MSKQQRDAIDAALRAEPFDLTQSTAEHRKSFDAFALRPYPADVGLDRGVGPPRPVPGLGASLLC